MNKILHAVALTVFASACWFVSRVLRMPEMVRQAEGQLLPPFTRLCMGVGPPLLAGLAIAGMAYCVYVWTRKGESRATWVGFLATTMSALLLVVLPTLVAMYLPLVNFVNSSMSH